MIIVVPCYNEFEKIDKNAFLVFLKNTENVSLVFSEDGSTDNTLSILEDIQNAFESRVHICRSAKNNGKAEAIRKAVLYCFENELDFDKIAFIDADLSVSLEECMSISELVTTRILFAFGSRISKIDNIIIRTKFRHYSGRFVATVISNLLEIPVYDTQCGCKIFEAGLARKIFRDEFISRWLFDVEIFFRIIDLYPREELNQVALEIPLKSWIDAGESKVKLSYFFKMWFDIYQIKREYREIYQQ